MAMTATETLLSAARESRLVIFAGAGVSIEPPSNLPSWRDVNRIVVRSLAAQAAEAIGEPLASKGADLILARHQQEKLPPEYQAQVLAELLHSRYFDVLRHLDSDRPNANHLAIAWLAKLGRVCAVVTTNFDRLIEAAFAAVDVPLERHFQPAHFRTLAGDLGRFERQDGVCQLLKLHGSVDDATTLIDTLAQRKQGFAAPVLDSVRYLLRNGHWLFLGFSGLDLEADANYLALAQEAPTAKGFVWLVREGTSPTPAVTKLKDRYGERGEIVTGNLPAWLLELASALSPEPREWIERRAVESQPLPGVSSTGALEHAAAAWATGLRPRICAMAVAFVVMACAEPQTAVSLVEALMREMDDHPPPDDPSPGFLLTKALAANALCILLGGLGRHEDAVRWGMSALELASQAGDADTSDRWRSNIALSLETLGRIREAREMYDTALAGLRSRGDPAATGAGLNGLAAHLIRQVRLDEARTLASEAVTCAQRAGDERFRGIALNLLGMVAKLKEEYPVALKLFEECETLFARLGNDEAVAAASANRGEVLAALGRHDEAAQIYKAVLPVLERIDRPDNLGAVYLSLGSLNRDRADMDAAENWYTKALETFRRLGDPSNQALALHHLASIKTKSGQYEEALAIATPALALVSERNPAFKANLLDQIGQANLRLYNLPAAEQAYREICVIAESTGIVRSLAGALTNLGTIMLLQQRDAEAATCFARGAALWQQLGRKEDYEYCEQAEAAVMFDQRIAALSDAGHRKTDPNEQRQAAREIVALYPELISRYESLHAMPLVAEFCASAASTAQFAGDWLQAIDWYAQAARVLQSMGGKARSQEMLTRGERLARLSADTLVKSQQGAKALPFLLRLADLAGQLGHRDVCATAMLNAAVVLVQTSQKFADARKLAAGAAQLVAPDSDDAAMAERIIAFCDQQPGG
jgi:tetratricopeptide (TPR) repeat protein